MTPAAVPMANPALTRHRLAASAPHSSPEAAISHSAAVIALGTDR